MEIADLGIVSYAGITALCLVAGLIVKLIPSAADEIIPVVCAVVGIVLGLVGFFCGVPDFPAEDPLNAAAVGAMSGLAATGIHQAAKQLSSKIGGAN